METIGEGSTVSTAASSGSSSSSSSSQPLSFLPRQLDISVTFWGSGFDDTSSSIPSNCMGIKDANKVKQCCIHTAHPIVLSSDRRQIVSLWNFRQKKAVFQKHISEIILLGTQSQSLMGSGLIKNFSKSYRRRDESSVFEFMKNKSYCRSTGLEGSNSMNTNSSHPHQQFQQIQEMERERERQIGDIVKVMFADRSYIACNSGLKFAVHTSLKGDLKRIMVTDSLVIILCEYALIFYDYISQSANVIRNDSNILQKSNPTSAEMIASFYCAIGCNDGVVRVLDLRSLQVVLTLAAHSKTDIVLVQNIPILRNFNNAVNGSNITAITSATTKNNNLIGGTIGTCNGIRFLTSGADNSAYIWYMALDNDGELLITSAMEEKVAPIAKLKGGLNTSSAGVTTSSSGSIVCAYYDEPTDTLFTTTANDKIVRMWDLNSLINKQRTMMVDAKTKRANYDTGYNPPVTANVNKNKSSAAGKSKNRRTTFFGKLMTGIGGMINEDTRVSAEMEVECMGVVKSGKGLSSVLKRFSSFSPVQHAHYVSGTYFACNKTRVVAILQAMDACTSQGYSNKSNFAGFRTIKSETSVAGGSVATGEYHTQSERNSVAVMGEKARSLFLIEEVFVPKLLEKYTQGLLSTQYMAVETFQDAVENLRVYQVSSAPCDASCIVLATSVGILTLSMLPRLPLTRMVGIHRHYGNMTVTYGERDNGFFLSRMWVSDGPQEDDVVDSYLMEGGNEDVFEDILEEYDLLQSEDMYGAHDSILGVAGGARRPTSGGVFGSSHNAGNMESLSVTKRSRFSIFSSAANQALPSVAEENNATGNSGKATASASSSLISPLPGPMASLINTSRPFIMPSFQGRYLILYWPQTLVYFVLSMCPQDNTGKNALNSSSPSVSPSRRLSNVYSSSGLKCFKDCILMRGICYGISWAGSGPEGGEICAVIDPPFKIQNNRRKSMFSWGRDSDVGSSDGYSKPKLRFYLLQPRLPPSVETTIEEIEVEFPPERSGATSTHQVKEAIEIFSGPLLCITAPLTSQQTDDKEAALVIRSRFYMLIPSISSHTGPQSPSSKQSMVLKEVGPLMLPVDRVEWEGSSLHCAVQYGNRTNILRVDKNITDNKETDTCTLRTISSFSAPDKPCTLSWLPDSGILFLATVNDIFMLLTDYPYSLGQYRALSDEKEGSNSVDSNVQMNGISGSGGGNGDSDNSSDGVDVGSVGNSVNKDDDDDDDDDDRSNKILIKLEDLSLLDTSNTSIDVLHVATTSFTKQGQSSGSRYLFTKPEGLVEIIGVRGTTLVLIDSEGRYFSFQLLKTINEATSPSGKHPQSTNDELSQMQHHHQQQHHQQNHQQQPFNPLLACALGLGMGAQGEILVELINTTVPLHYHNQLVAMLLRRGLVLEALDLKGISLSLKIESIVRHDMKEQAITLYTSIVENPVDHCPSIVMLMLYMLHHHLLPEGFESPATIERLEQHANNFDEVLMAVLQFRSTEKDNKDYSGQLQGNVALLKALKLYSLALQRNDEGNSAVESELKEEAISMAKLTCSHYATV